MNKRIEEMPVVNRAYTADLYERDWFGILGSSLIEQLAECSSKKAGKAIFSRFNSILHAAGERRTPEQIGVVVDQLGNISLITLHDEEGSVL